MAVPLFTHPACLRHDPGSDHPETPARLRVLLERAQSECISDEGRRRVARGRAAVTRERADARYVRQFAELIRSLYPGCPEEEALAVAARACEKHSGRVGRSAAAKELAADAVDLAVKAHIRHTHTKEVR